MSGRDELWRLTATEVVDLLRGGSVSPLEAIDSLEMRHAEVDEAINALPITCFDRARGRVQQLAGREAREMAQWRWLAGLPIAVKDLSDVAGVRSTLGGIPAFADRIPASSAPVVARLEENGGVVVAKSASPELGFHATTTSRLFGPTRNPHDVRLTTGGSSGGAAAALASGQAWLATGSDLGASIRLPASMCGVVGLRPSPGLVPGPVGGAYDPLPVGGPMARSVADIALMLDAMVGPDPLEPLGVGATRGQFSECLTRQRPQSFRAAISHDLGVAPVAAEVAGLFYAAMDRLADGGVDLVRTSPNFQGVREAFYALRGYGHVVRLAPLIEEHGRDAFMPEILWTLDNALKLNVQELAGAARWRARLAEAMSDLFTDFDVLICPASPVLPFPAEQTHISAIDDIEMTDYLDWITLNFAISLTSCPALSLPCAVSPQGMPLGVQVVGPPRSEARVLSVGKMMEDLLGMGHLVPVTPKSEARS